MITLRRDRERLEAHGDQREVWLTFHPEDPPGPLSDGFGVLSLFNEIRLGPGGVAATRPRGEAEIVTHVLWGTLAQEDSTGSSGVLPAGEFQCLSTGRSVHHKESNASRTARVHFFQLALQPSQVGLDRASVQRRFMAAQRRNVLCAVASPDRRAGSLRIHQDAVVYSALLDAGHHIAHELAPGRSAWLHVVHGEATLGGAEMTTGDGAGITAERAISLTARKSTEILLIDLGTGRPVDGVRG